MNIKKHIPNAITCGNLLCGCFGILFTMGSKLHLAFLMVILAAILDFFDGFMARLFKVSSPIGKDLDSLADLVTFGVLPGFIMYNMIGFSCIEKSTGILIFQYLPFLAFLIPVFSAIRLAKFNNDPRQSDSFIGVPTPANALLISSLGLILFTKLEDGKELLGYLKLIYNSYSLTGLTILMSYLLVAELPLFALKFKNFNWIDNKIRYLFLMLSAILLILFKSIAIPFIIFLYIVLSIINNSINRINS